MKTSCAVKNVPKHSDQDVQLLMVTAKYRDKNYRDLTEKSFKTRAEIVEAAKRAEAIVQLYKISKRVKNGTRDADDINFYYE